MNEKEMAACWILLKDSLEKETNGTNLIVRETSIGVLWLMDRMEEQISEMSKAVNNG